MTNNKQQMGVDFFYDEVWACFSSNLSWSKCERLKKIKDQAKEMEKERIETAYNKGTVHGIDYPESTLPLTGEQYYIETYGGVDK
jgi:hypothetical protein